MVICLRTRLAFDLCVAGQLEEPERIDTDNYEPARCVLDDEAPELIWAGSLHGMLLAERGRLKKAETVLRDMLLLTCGSRKVHPALMASKAL